MARILIVEDEPAIADTLVYALRADGHNAEWVMRAGELLTRMRDQPADLVLLDVGLPDVSGFEACRSLRQFSDVPVIFLTARGDEIDRVVGLEIGADDYVVKPFSLRELVARVRVVLRRRASPRSPASTAIAQAPGEFQIDDAQRCVTYCGQLLALTPHEYHLLARLLSQPRRVFSREQLLDALGVASDAGYARNIDGHVKDLRAKLRAIDAEAEPIQTHRGFGYSYQPSR